MHKPPRPLGVRGAGASHSKKDEPAGWQETSRQGPKSLPAYDLAPIRGEALFLLLRWTLCHRSSDQVEKLIELGHQDDLRAPVACAFLRAAVAGDRLELPPVSVLRRL